LPGFDHFVGTDQAEEVCQKTPDHLLKTVHHIPDTSVCNPTMVRYHIPESDSFRLFRALIPHT
jgi:hypothetical protein